MSRTGLGLALASLVLALAGQYFLSQHLSLTWGLVLFGVAVALFVLPASGEAPPPGLRVASLPTLRFDRQRQRSASFLTAGLLVLVSLILFGMSLWAFARDADSPWGWPPFLASLAVFSAAVHLLGRFQGKPEALLGGPRSRRSAANISLWLVLLLVLGLALFLRTYRADSLPYGLWVDEAIHGLRAMDILNNPSYLPVYIPGTIATPSPFVYLQAVSVEVLGPTLSAIRLPAAILGTITVWLFFLLARDWFNWKVALVGAFLMAVSFWFVLWGRSGMPMVTAPLVTVLAILLLTRALRHGNLTDYLWAGLALGASAWSYSALRIFPFVVIIILLYLLVSRRDMARRVYPGIVIFVVAALLAAGPILEYMTLHSGDFLARAQQVSIFRDKPWSQGLLEVRDNLVPHLLMFNEQGDLNGRHNLPGEPLLDFGIGALAVLGLGYTLRHLNRPMNLLLMLWFLIMLVPAVFTLRFEAPQSLRAVGTLPVVYLFSMVAIHRVWGLWDAAFVPPARLTFVALLVVGLAVIGYLNYTQYFQRYADSRRVSEDFFPRETYIVYRLREPENQGAAVYTTSAWNLSFIQRFLAPTTQPSHNIVESPEAIPIAVGPLRALLFIDPRLGEIWQRAQQCYPQAPVSEFQAPDASSPPFLFVIDLNAEQIRRGTARCPPG